MPPFTGTDPGPPKTQNELNVCEPNLDRPCSIVPGSDSLMVFISG